MFNEREYFDESLYLHVCNSGATFTVAQTQNGCTFKVAMQAFGNLGTIIAIDMSNEAVKELAKLLQKASEHQFTENENAALAVPLKSNGNLECTIISSDDSPEVTQKPVEDIIAEVIQIPKPIPYPEQADIKGKAESDMKDKGWV